MTRQLQAAHQPVQTHPVAGPLLQRTCACGKHAEGGECEDCNRQRVGTLQRAAVSADPTGATAPPIVHDVLRSPGQPLDDATRGFMDPQFGHDFSHVRVHAADRAAASARVVHARASTVAHPAAFAAGRYRPGAALQRMVRTGVEAPEADATSRASRHLEHDVSQMPLHPPAVGVSQTKLEINEPGDSCEQDADHVAEQVMHTAEPRHQRAFPYEEEYLTGQTAQPGRDRESVQTMRVQASDTGQTTAPAIVHDVLRSPGQLLDPATRAFMEPRFGHDFSRVQVHTGVAAEQSAREVNAHAYTVGHHMVFGAHKFAPETREGRDLLAHELTHVLQQEGASQLRLSRQSDLTGSGLTLTMPDPRSLRGSLDLRDLGADELNREIERIQQWLSAHPQHSDSEHLRSELKRLAIGLAAQKELNEEAERLGERQAKRREVMDSLPTDEYWAKYVLKIEKFRNKLVEFDIYWDEDAKSFLRRPYVDAMEREVNFNKEAKQIYYATLMDRTLNKPVKKSWFDRAITVICENVNPCKGPLEQFRERRASGMSREEALKLGVERVMVEGMISMLPGRGPSGPIPLEVGPSRGPSFNVPVPKTGEVGALGKTPVPPRAEPTADPMLMVKKPPTTTGRGPGSPERPSTPPAPAEPTATAPARPAAGTPEPIKTEPAEPKLHPPGTPPGQKQLPSGPAEPTLFKPYVNRNPKATPSEIQHGELLNKEAQSGRLPGVKEVVGAAEIKGEPSGDYRFIEADGSQVRADLWEPKMENVNNMGVRLIKDKSGQAETVVIKFGERQATMGTAEAQKIANDVLGTPGHSITRIIVVKNGKIIFDSP